MLRYVAMTSDLPTGLITFLFTDIAGSTRLWREHPEAMREAVARHDVILTDAIERHGGCVVKSRLEGDSFFAVFRLVTEAVAASCDILQALADEPWPTNTPISVRGALHTGEAQLRGEDYYGPVVNMCARMRSAAHAGQFLLSAQTDGLLRDALPRHGMTVSLGAHRLRDMGHARELYQLVCPGRQHEFPPIRSFDSRPNNLPLQLTSLVGREHDVGIVGDLLRRHRLVTLTGPGGCGKTRLALQAVADVLEEFPDGAWLADFSGLSDPALVQHELAASLCIISRPGVGETDRLCDHLAEMQAIVILDNCERVLAACAELAVSILTHCEGVRVLATSRERLNVPGEVVWVVPPLAVPPEGEDPRAIEEYAAVRLFVDRALSRLPCFEITDQSAGALVRLCRRLEGMPLAIELAAALVGTLSVEQIADRIGDQLDLLAQGSHQVVPHHQSLRATIDWSFDLLHASERSLFRSLAVFSGFDLAAVEEVWRPENEAEELIAVGAENQALEVLTRLVDKSLVVVESQSGSVARYRLLETLRDYARAQLRDSSDEDGVRRRHARYYLGLVEAARDKLGSASERDAIAALALEHENIWTALGWCVDNRRPDWALAACETLCRYWYVRQQVSEGRRWLESLLDLPEAQEATADVAAAVKSAGNMAYFQGDLDAAERLYLRSLDCYRELEDERGIAVILNNLGNVARQRNDYDRAQRLYEQSLQISGELGDRALSAKWLRNLAALMSVRGDLGAARRHASDALEIYETDGDAVGVALTHITLGVLEVNEGNIELGRSHLRQSLTMHRALKDDLGVANALAYLGSVAYLDGDRDLAREQLEESLLLMEGKEHELWQAQALDTTGDIMLDEGDPGGALDCYRQSFRIRLVIGAMSNWIQSLECMARHAVVVQQPERALQLAGAAAQLRRSSGTPLKPIERGRFEQCVADAESQMSREAARDAWERGWALSVDEAVCLALQESP